jgi:hypothetical protein
MLAFKGLQRILEDEADGFCELGMDKLYLGGSRLSDGRDVRRVEEALWN